MRPPFVVAVPTAELAARLDRILRARGAPATVERTAVDGVRVGLRDLDGPPRWLASPLPDDDEAIVRFLERWGFIARAA